MENNSGDCDSLPALPRRNSDCPQWCVIAHEDSAGPENDTHQSEEFRTFLTRPISRTSDGTSGQFPLLWLTIYLLQPPEEKHPRVGSEQKTLPMVSTLAASKPTISHGCSYMWSN